MNQSLCPIDSRLIPITLNVDPAEYTAIQILNYGIEELPTDKAETVWRDGIESIIKEDIPFTPNTRHTYLNLIIGEIEQRWVDGKPDG